MDWAKMMGMTPLIFTFMGMCGLAAVHLPAHPDAWHTAQGSGARAPLTQVISTISSRMPTMTSTAIHHFRVPARKPSTIWDTMLGTAGDDAGEQDDGDAVAHAELGDLLTQPHHEGRAGDEGHVMTRAAHTDVLLRMP